MVTRLVSEVRRWLLPAQASAAALPVLGARGLRALVDGYMSVLLPAYLLVIGLSTLQVGIVASATLLGSALATMLVGLQGHRIGASRLLAAAALLMVATGLGFAGLTAFWPLLLVAFIGTLNPSAGDVSVFLPLEHARLAAAAEGHVRTALFARYSVIGALCASLGALAAGVPAWLQKSGWSELVALRAMILLYALVGLWVWWLYRRNNAAPAAATPPHQPLRASRGIVIRLALLFSVDAFAGGLVVNALMSLWLLERFDLSLAQAGLFFFWTGLLSAASQLAAAPVARRIGLLNTMVFTHIPSSVCLIGAALVNDVQVALGLLCVRAALSQMDVPTRSAFVMAVVTPAERPAAASLTAVPRSLAAALSPTLAFAMFSVGWLAAPLVACGLLKIGYDVVLWFACRKQVLPEPA
jgi:MFS family permease